MGIERVKSIYLIGSLRNPKIPYFAQWLRKNGFSVFDSWFAPGPHADDYWRKYTKIRKLSYKEALKEFAAEHIYRFDKKHLDRSDIAIMLMPAGKSGHLELGYMIGKGRKGFILFDKIPKRYDVMTQFATEIFFNKKDLLERLRNERE